MTTSNRSKLGFHAADAVGIGDGPATTVSIPVVKPVAGIVRGRIVDNAGRGLNGTLRFAGAGNFEARSDDRGAFSAARPQAFLEAKIEAPGLPGRELS